MKMGRDDIRHIRICLPAPSIVAGKMYISLLYCRYLVRVNQIRPVPLPIMRLYVYIIIEPGASIMDMPTIWSALLRRMPRVQ